MPKLPDRSPSRRIARVACATLFAVAACGGGASRDDEIRLLLDLDGAVEHDAPLYQREPAVARLSQVRFVDPDVRAARDTCMVAYSRLIEAERLQAKAMEFLQAENQDMGLAAVARSTWHIEGAEEGAADCRHRLDALHLELARR